MDLGSLAKYATSSLSHKLISGSFSEADGEVELPGNIADTGSPCPIKRVQGFLR